MPRDDPIEDALNKGFLGKNFDDDRIDAVGMFQPVPGVAEFDIAQDASGGDVREEFTTFDDIHSTSSDKIMTVIKEIEFLIQVEDEWQLDEFGDFGSALTDGIQLSMTIGGESIDFGPLIEDNSDLIALVGKDNFEHIEDDGTTVLGYISATYEFDDPLILFYDDTDEDEFTMTINGATDDLSTMADAKLYIRGNDYIQRS